jgi:hypothetical protein
METGSPSKIFPTGLHSGMDLKAKKMNEEWVDCLEIHPQCLSTYWKLVNIENWFKGKYSHWQRPMD